MGGVDPQGLPGSHDRYFNLSLQIPPARPGRTGDALSEDIAETRMRYGYRRVHVVLQREGWMINIKRTYRLYRGLGLQLHNMEAPARHRSKHRADGRSGG
jgi:transposase InsO family protein